MGKHEQYQIQGIDYINTIISSYSNSAHSGGRIRKYKSKKYSKKGKTSKRKTNKNVMNKKKKTHTGRK